MPHARPELPAAAYLPVPSWMWGGNPGQFFTAAALHARRTATPGRWRVQTQERYRQVRPSLIFVEHLLGPATSRPRLDRLAAAAAASFLPDLGGGFPAEIDEVRRRAAQTNSLVDVTSSWINGTAVAPLDQLEKTVEAVHRDMIMTPLDADTTQHPLADAGAHLIRRAPEVVHRAKLAAVLLQAEHSPIPMSDRIQQLRAAADAGELVFAASQHLFEGLLLGDAYLGPLLGALTPHVWAFAAHRPLGNIVYTLGNVLLGTPGRATELLHLLPSQGGREITTRAQVPATAAAAALDWWTARLNDLFGVLTDPAIFTDREQLYHPVKHLQAVLTVEQLFRRVGSIQTNHREDNGRRVLLFTVIDTLERLTGRRIDKLCLVTTVQARLDALRAVIPADAAPILLPGAQRALDALRRLQGGFYLSRQHGADTITVPQPDGAARVLDLAAAAAEYIKVLRDATHGHGSNRHARIGITNTLLAHHNGHIPQDLALLGYLYLLDVLAHPTDLAHHLHRGGAV